MDHIMSLAFTMTSPKQQIRSTIRHLSAHVRKTSLRKRLTVLSVSLIDGRFKAMSIIDDLIHLSWERPGIILKPEPLRQAIADAIRHTEFPGRHISILVEDRRFISLTLQLPMMSLTDLIPILERKAQQVKAWEGPAAWRHHLGIQARGQQNIYLEIWPQQFIDDILLICDELQLELQQLAPLSALAESQLGTLPVEPGEATILISMLEGNVMFVAGGEDGTSFLIRHLAPAQDWVSLGERIGTEVNRTIMFINQQVNLTVSQIWFLGEEERLTLEEVQPHVSTPILPCPVNPDWQYWLWIGATLPMNLSNNFTPPEVRRAPMRKKLTNAIAASIAVIMIVCVGTTGIIEGYFAKNQVSVQAVIQQAEALQQDQQLWEGRLVTLRHKRQWMQGITSRPSSLEGPFLSYLGTLLLPQTVLNKVSITRTPTKWEVEITGSTDTNLAETLLLLEQLITQLAAGPYHVAVEHGWRDQLLAQTVSASTHERTGPHYRFTLKGQIS